MVEVAASHHQCHPGACHRDPAIHRRRSKL